MITYKTLITAHSGADATPANSMEFAQYALASDADAIEVDVRRQPGGNALILSHDAPGDGAQTLLQQVFEKAAGQASVRVNCDLKELGLESQVVALANRMGILDRLIFSGTVDPTNLRDLPILGQQVYWNIDEQIPALYARCQRDPAYALEAAEEMCRRCAQFGVQTINAYEGLVDDRFLDILCSHHIAVSVWTVDDEARLAYFLSRGVRNITTRRLTAALSMRRQRR